MKSHTFLPTFIRYSFIALITLWIVYLLADMHINKIPGFSLEEGFLIASEALVFCAFTLAFKDSRPTMIELLEDSMKSFAKSIEEHNARTCKEHDERYSETQEGPSLPEDKIPDWLKPTHKTGFKKGQTPHNKGKKMTPAQLKSRRKKIEQNKLAKAEAVAQEVRFAKTATNKAKRVAKKKTVITFTPQKNGTLKSRVSKK